MKVKTNKQTKTCTEHTQFCKLFFRYVFINTSNIKRVLFPSLLRYVISAHWWGFNDPQSTISRYEWRAGTEPKSDNIMKPIPAHRSEFAFHVLENPLPSNVTIVITVRAYNRAGLWIEVSSDGFQVDDTKPIIVRNVTRDCAFGKGNTQVRKL